MSFDGLGGLLGEFVFCHGLTGANEASALSVLSGDLALPPGEEGRCTHLKLFGTEPRDSPRLTSPEWGGRSFCQDGGFSVARSMSRFGIRIVFLARLIHSLG